MAEEPSSPQRILDAAEAVLRRHGVGKTNVVDIARALGMSHANVYRHFPSKKALLDAVAARWLAAVTAPLEAITHDRGRPAAERLEAWFDTLRAIKRRKILHDPELFRVYHGIATNAHEAVAAHVGDLLGQIEHILRDGVSNGEFPAGLETRTAARAFLHGTV